MNVSLVVAQKEIRDHGRDLRSLLSSALLALMGPGVVLLVSLSGRARGGEGVRVIVSMLSVFALVTAFAGGADVALDATAGERERRSLVPLLLNPIPSFHIVVGKWIAVAAVGLAALAVNAAGLVLVLARAAPVALASYAPLLATWTVLGLVPLALLGAAVNVLVAAMCRTTKEAHSALRGLMFVPMLVGMFLVFFPAWTGRYWFLVPIAGQQGLIGLGGAVPIARAAVLAVITTAAAVPMLAGAVAVLRRDDILSD